MRIARPLIVAAAVAAVHGSLLPERKYCWAMPMRRTSS